MSKPKTHPTIQTQTRSLIATIGLATLIAVSAQGQAFNFSTGNLTYNENFDSMGAAGTAPVTGWLAVRGAGSGTPGQVLTLTASAGTSGTGGGHNLGTNGVNAATDRAFGTLASGTTVPYLSALFTNSTGGTITNVNFAGFAEQWRTGDNAAVEVCTFEYSLDATGPTNGTWTAISGMNLVEILTATIANAPVDGNAPANRASISGTSGLINWPNASTLWIRWRDANDAGTDGAYAIDDFAMTVEVQPPGLPPSVADIQPPTVVTNNGNTVNFTVTFTGDAPDFYWYKIVGAVTNLIPTATTATLTLANVLAVDTADYQVVLSNAFGMSTSAVVSLTVIDPVLLSGPVSQLNLEGSISGFSVNATGSSLQYQWYRGTPPGGTPLSDGGRIAGAQTRFLTISNTAAADADDYYAIVSNGSGSITTDPATLTTTSAAGTLVTWGYNAVGMNVTNAEPTQGQATARTTTVGTTNSFQPTGGSANDPINSVLGATNYYFGSATYPAQATSNKTTGVQFKVSTLGFKNLTVTFDQRASGTGSKYTRLQYTINGTDYIDYPVSTSFFNTVPAWESRSYSLVGFPGVANNPDFGLRVVSEFESTATLGAINNANYVGLAGTSGSYGTGGTLSYDLVKVNAEPISSGTPPTISAIGNQSTPNITPIQVNFTVGDAQTAVGNLIVTASSYNETLVASGNITPGGAGASRNITITPSGVEGVCPILVSVTDADGDVASTWFNLTLTPVNATPTITQIPNTNTLANTPISIPFVIGDDSPVNSLTLVSNSLNTTLIPLANIAITGSGANRTLVLTPVAANAGVAPISISVSDGVNTATTSFALTVRPTTNVVFNDYFGYADGTLTNVTGFFWSAHSEGLTGPISVAGGRATIDSDLSQDCNAPLIGAPYVTNSSAVLYSSFKVNFSELPTAAGAYFAHFKDNSTFGFYARVWATTNGAASGKLRLSIGNSSNVSATSGQFPRDLDTGVDYTVVTRLVLSNGVSTLWINPTSESDTQVTDPTVITNSGGVYQYALRQSTGHGTLAFDDLIVGTSFADVVPVLTVNQFAAYTVVSWANPLLPLQAASLVTGTYTNIPGATSPYTNAFPESQKFFRLFKP